uniref:Uncharacterized protein n=1 Tax=Timema cristinae TaxID=61476 RepID=A0A7R9HCR2_TIMCR|nr:unnamed protein product [Timema cristinae]
MACGFNSLKRPFVIQPPVPQNTNKVPSRLTHLTTTRPQTPSYLVVGESPVLVDGVDLRDLGPYWFPLKDCLLFSLREQRNLIIDVLEHDEDRGLGGQLLGTVVLEQQSIIECVELIGLCRGARHESVEHCGVSVYTGAAENMVCAKQLQSVKTLAQLFHISPCRATSTEDQSPRVKAMYVLRECGSKRQKLRCY